MHLCQQSGAVHAMWPKDQIIKKQKCIKMHKSNRGICNNLKSINIKQNFENEQQTPRNWVV